MLTYRPTTAIFGTTCAVLGATIALRREMVVPAAGTQRRRGGRHDPRGEQGRRAGCRPGAGQAVLDPADGLYGQGRPALRRPGALDRGRPAGQGRGPGAVATRSRRAGAGGPRGAAALAGFLGLRRPPAHL